MPSTIYYTTIDAPFSLVLLVLVKELKPLGSKMSIAYVIYLLETCLERLSMLVLRWDSKLSLSWMLVRLLYLFIFTAIMIMIECDPFSFAYHNYNHHPPHHLVHQLLSQANQQVMMQQLVLQLKLLRVLNVVKDLSQMASLEQLIKQSFQINC